MNGKFFKTVAVIITLLGIVLGIVLGFACQINISNWYSSAKYTFNTGLMFETWIVADLIALFFTWMGAVLEKLEKIEVKLCGKIEPNSQSEFKDNIMGTVNSTVDKIKSFSTASTENSVPTENEWKCPNCGAINQNYTGTCGCGQQKPKI